MGTSNTQYSDALQIIIAASQHGTSDQAPDDSEQVVKTSKKRAPKAAKEQGENNEQCYE